MTANPRSSAPGTRSSIAVRTAQSIATSEKSESRRVASSSENSPDKSPSATASANPRRLTRSIASTPSSTAPSARVAAAAGPRSINASATSGSAAIESRRNGECRRARASTLARDPLRASRFMTAARSFTSGNDGNPKQIRSFVDLMKLEQAIVSAADVNAMDRQVIRVNTPAAHAGITAALRRAFEAAATDPCDRDFAELLRRLN
jgi:hypothetical protein